MISKEENILFAAEKLFANKGFKGTSTREISREANVNISMISYYFGSKEQLYEKLLEYRSKEGQFFSKEIIERTDINEWEKLVLTVKLFTERVRNHKNFYTILQREQLYTSNPKIMKYLKDTKMSFIEMYSKLLEDGIKSGIFTKKPPVSLLHSTVSGTLFYACNAKDMYKTFLKNTENQDVYDGNYYKELNLHLKNLLKHLLGYDENI